MPAGHSWAHWRSCWCLYSWSVERCHSYVGRKAMLALLWHRHHLTQAANFRQKLIRVIVTDMQAQLKCHHFLRGYRSFTWLVDKKFGCYVPWGFYAIGVQLTLCRNTDALLDHLSMLRRRQPALGSFRIVQAPWKMVEMLKEPAQLQQKLNINGAALTKLSQLKTFLPLIKN